MKRRILLIVLFFITVSHTLNAQNKVYHVGIFAPLYLDSVFNSSGDFNYTQGFPKFILPGVDFVQGAEAALDSMDIGNINIDASIYDSKSYKTPVWLLIKNKELDNLDLIIGSVKDAEFKELADFALRKKIPFISATYPNDGGIASNPFLVIMNSTLKAHCEAIYSYLLQNHGTDKIFLCRRKGTQEDKIAFYFKKLNEQDGKPLLNIQTLNVDSIVTYDFLKPKLDSNRQSVIIGGSLDENFTTSIAETCSDLHSQYPITLIGMPNWGGFKELTKKDEFEEFPIYYTSPYFNNKWDSYSKMLLNNYTIKYNGNPTDMAFKGFECTYLFTKLLIKYPDDLMKHLNDKTYKVFSDYNFSPVVLKKENSLPDYYENKHEYFIKILNGAATKAW
jgi:hypothetical protein